MTSVSRPQDGTGLIPEEFKTNGQFDAIKVAQLYHDKANANDRSYKLEDIGKSMGLVAIVGAGRPIGSHLFQRNKFNEEVLMAPRMVDDRVVSYDVVNESAFSRHVNDADINSLYWQAPAPIFAISPEEHASRWREGVWQLTSDWLALPVRSDVGDALAYEVRGMLRRREIGGSNSTTDRGLVSRMRSTLRMGYIANRLIAIAGSLGNGDSAAVMTTANSHCIFLLSNPEGAFMGLCDMSDNLPKFIDGVPDYLYNATISAIGWRGLKDIPPHMEKLIRKSMTFGGFDDKSFDYVEVVHHPEFVTKLPPVYATGKITMEEVEKGMASPHTRPILIK